MIRHVERFLGGDEILGRQMHDPASTRASQATLFRVYRDAVLIVIPSIFGIGIFLQHWLLLAVGAVIAYAWIIRCYWYDTYNQNRRASCGWEEAPDVLAEVRHVDCTGDGPATGGRASTTCNPQ